MATRVVLLLLLAHLMAAAVAIPVVETRLLDA